MIFGRNAAKAWLTILLLSLLNVMGCRQESTNPPALSPAEAVKSFQLSEDFTVEVFLSEPNVIDPVEMVFDEDGHIYVAEMLDYPEDPPPGQPVRSRIRLLVDNDGDGRMDRVTIFADRILQVSGILPWKGGLIVTSAPDILFLKDTDGDGQADERRVLYTGFPTVNPEGRITNLRLGIDNWIYAANNGADGKITSPEWPDQPMILVRGADFRFRPDQGIAEPASGPAQFGLTFDDWGNRFITQNTIHLRHVVVPMQYLTKAPFLNVSAMAQDISDHGRPSAPMFPLTQPQQWRVERTQLRQQRYNENQLNRTEHLAGYFTAASGSTVYTGDVFPQEYWGNIFTGDVSGNLIHRDILTPEGVSFSARRAKDGVEFLASTDQWFRPCNFANAPDGNLYVMDIYRLFIETPESIPEEIKKDMDFYAGDDQGRIYRIRPNQPLRQRDLKPRLGSASAAELVAQLENTNGWHRQTAQRLLVERQDKTAVPLLQKLVEQSSLPQARLHALWTLEGLGALQPTEILRALKDSEARVREHAVRLAEMFFPQAPEVVKAVLELQSDSDLRVQYQRAFSLGQLNDQRALEALAEVALERGADQWFRLAVLSSVANRPAQFFDRLRAKQPNWENKELLTQLASLIGAKHDPAELGRFLQTMSRNNQAEAGLKGLANGLKLTGVKNLSVPQAEAALAVLLKQRDEAVQLAAWEAARYLSLPKLIEQAKADALAPKLPLAQRAMAVRALRGGQFDAVESVLRRVLTATEPPELQIAAVEAYSAFESPAIAEQLLTHWSTYTPEVRQRVIAALLRQRSWTESLIKALEAGQVERTVVDITARASLLDYPDQALAQRAKQLFQDETRDRQQMISSYRESLNLTGDVNRGKQVFDANCARCHMPQRERGRIGPDLSGISNKTKEELLTSILNPSYAIEPRYVNYIVTTKEGRMYDGVLANETPGAITLRGGSVDGDAVILRQNIAEIRAASTSLMPDGFERSIDKQAMADLISFLRGGL